MPSPTSIVLPAAGAAPPAQPAAPAAPVHLTSFVGREREIGELGQLLASTRLLTLTGAGGSGKSRLAAEVAGRFAAERQWRCAWVELAALREPALLPHHLASALGHPAAAAGGELGSLAGVLGGRELLLVLDNCEHLVDACAHLADALLRACPGLVLLVTSREALGIAGERAWLVPPLSLAEPRGGAPPEELLRSEAVRLFTERAQAVLSDFQLTEENAAAVASICHRLDGLPLAIELAAARVRVLSPQQIRERLDDSFRLLTHGGRTAVPRHRTLREVTDWSYALLSAPEQLLLQHVSVFAGGFSLESAEAVCACDGVDAAEVLDLLSALVDKSLVATRPGGGQVRYALLETVRQYARERLGERDTAGQAHVRHAHHYRDLAERAAAQLHGPEQMLWLLRLEEEHDNLRAALRWSIQEGDADLAARLGAATWEFWRMRSHHTEGREWLRQVLMTAPPEGAAGAWVLCGAGVLTRFQGDVAGACVYLERAAALARSVDDAPALAAALTHLGIAQVGLGDRALAHACLDEALALWERLGVAAGRALALTARGGIATTEGELETAQELYEAALSCARVAGDREGESRALVGLAALSRVQGDLPRARSCYHECLALYRDLGNVWHSAATLHDLGHVALRAGDAGDAEACFGESLALFRELGSRVGVAACAAGLAGILGLRGSAALGARLMSAAGAEFDALGNALSAADQADWRAAREHMEQALGTAAFAAAWTQGASDPLDLVLAAAEAALAAAPPPAADPALPSVPVAAPTAAPAPASVPALRVRALGPLEIELHGQPMDSDAWSYTRPRELLLYLLCHPEGRTREQIGLVFWPDASAAQVKNSFHVMLHHLRKSLGSPDWLVLEAERYRVSPRLELWFDASAFEAAATTALRALPRPLEALPLLQAALALYRGDFLAEERAGDWHLEVHDRLRRLQVDCLGALGDLHLERGETALAAEAYERLLRREELREDVHRRLVVCLARLGRRSEALRQCERFALLLREELDTDPEPETLLLCERVRRSEAV